MNIRFCFFNRAVLLVQYGIPVMPLEPAGKKAFLKDWQVAATTNPVQLAEWNTEKLTYNCAAVARKGGFWFLDIDNPSVFALIEAETAHSLSELDTLVVRSSGVKGHIYFKHDARSESRGNFRRSDEHGELFSVRALNEYVVGPLSVHPTTQEHYGPVKTPSGGVIPVAPDWLHNWLDTQNKIPGRPRESAPATIPAKIPIHDRNNTLTSRAGTMRNKGFSEPVILAAIQAINQTECAEPLPEKELETIAHSVARYAPGEVKYPVGDYRKTSDSIHVTELVFHRDAVATTEADYFQYVVAPTPPEQDGWFPLGSVSLVGAPSGAGKTTTIYQLLLTQACGGRFLEHETYGRTFQVMGLDRGPAAHARTMRRMRRKASIIPFIPLTTSYDTAAVQQVVTRLEALETMPQVLFIEGVDMMLSRPGDGVCTGNLMDHLHDIATRFHIAIIGSLGSPKVKVGHGYAAKRDNLLGSQAWARKAETVLNLQFPGGDDTKGQRVLFVMPRNAPVETFTLGFVAGNLEIQHEAVTDDKHIVDDGKEFDWFRVAPADGWTVGDMERALHWSYSKAYRRVQEAVAHGLVEIKPNDKHSVGRRALYVSIQPQQIDEVAVGREESDEPAF